MIAHLKRRAQCLNVSQGMEMGGGAAQRWLLEQMLNVTWPELTSGWQTLNAVTKEMAILVLYLFLSIWDHVISKIYVGLESRSLGG